VVNPLRAFSGLYDAFISEINPTGTGLVWSTTYGGSGSDSANAIALDASGNIYTGGQTASPDFPVLGAIRSSYPGAVVGWVMRVGATYAVQYLLTTASSPVAGGTETPPSSSLQNANAVVSVQAIPASGYSFVNWSGPVANANNASTTVTMTGPMSITANFTVLPVGAAPVSVLPSAGTSGRQVFTFVVRDPSGANSIQYAQLLFSKPGITALNACYVSHDPAANVFYLLSDDTTQWYGPLGGVSSSIGNSQCTIYGATSGSTKSGTDLTTMLDVSFRSGFSGTKGIYGFSGDTLGHGSGWQQLGTWSDSGVR
jgi:hypothetical protein